MTTTRYYFAHATASPITPAFQGSWDATGNALRRKLLAAPGAGTEVGTVSNAETSTSPQNLLGYQHNTDPLPAGEITGQIRVVMQIKETQFGADAIARCHVSLIAADGTTVLATLGTGTNPTEANIVEDSRTITLTLAGPVTVPAGAYLSVESGTRHTNTSSTSTNSSTRVQAVEASYTDHNFVDSEAVASKRGWIEFTFTDPPAAPTGLVADPTTTTIDLDWNASAGATSYEVRLDGGAPTDVGNVLTHTFTGLTANTEYDLEVRAKNGGGTSAWSLLTATTDLPAPAAPDVTLDATATVITATWPAVTYAAGYDARLDGGAIVDLGNVLEHDFTGLTANTEYDVEVRAYNGTGDSAWDLETITTDLPAPAAPAPAATLIDFDRIALAWPAVTYATNYDARLDGGAVTALGNVLAHTFTGLDNDTTYTLEVRASNGTGASAWTPLALTTLLRPLAGPVTDRVFDGLPEVYRHADSLIEYPLLRWLAGLFDQLTPLEELRTRFAYVPTDEQG